jgi:hypothetical protein
MSASQNYPAATTSLNTNSLPIRTNTVSDVLRLSSKLKEGSTSKDPESRKTLSSVSSFDLVVPPWEGYSGASGFVKSFSWCLTIFLFATLLLT